MPSTENPKIIQVFKGSYSNIYLSTFLFVAIGIAAFVALLSVVPPLLRLPFVGIIGIAIVIFVLSIIQQRRGFFLEQRSDGSLRIVRAAGPIAEAAANSFQLSRNGMCLNLTKDNVITVSTPTEEDRKRIWDWLPERKALMIFSPFKRTRFDWRWIRQIGKKEFEHGFGPYSLAFVSHMNNLVKIVVHKLHVKDAVQEFDVDDALIFVSLKENKDLISSLQR